MLNVIRGLSIALNKLHDIPLTQDLIDKLPQKTKEGLTHYIIAHDTTLKKQRCQACRHFNHAFAQDMIAGNPVFREVLKNRTVGQLAASANGDFRKDADGMTEKTKAIIGEDETLTADRFGWCFRHEEMRHLKDRCKEWQ